ncbi:MAG: AraC family transcriptional regulator [Myxococcaceae bacterium]
MPAGPTISTRYAERILDTAAKSGVSRSSLLELAPLHPVDRHGDPRISANEYYGLWAAAMERTHDAAFPLRVAQSTGIETYEIFGFAMMTSGSFREGLENAARYLGIWTDVASWELHVAKGLAELRLVPAELRHPGSRFAAECAIAEVVHTSRNYLGVKWKPEEVRFPWRKPGDVQHLVRFFDAPVKFERPFAALVFDEQLLSLPPVKADPAMARFFKGHADALLDRAPKDAGAATEVRRFVASALQSGTPTLADAAKKLATSTRTLRRRLAEEGHTFAELLQQTRCALAKQHLAERKLSVSEIAFVLGFSDASAFHRSFRRSTGMTPAAFRETSAR